MNWLILTLLLADVPAKSLAVLPFTGRDTNAQDKAALTEILSAELRRATAGAAQWVDASAIQASLSTERQADLVACTTAGCMANQSAPLHADQLCVGRLDKVGGTWIVRLKLLDVRSAVYIAQSDRRLKNGNLADVQAALPAMVSELTSKAYPSGWLDVTTDPNSLSVSVGGSVAGKAPLQLRVAPGALTLHIEDPCFDSKPLRVEIKEGQHTAAALTGVPRLAPLQLQMHDTTGAAAQGQASIDGTPLGAAPGNYNVPACARELKVTSSGGEVWTSPLELTKRSAIDVVIAAPPPRSKTLAYIFLGAGAALIAGGVVIDTVPASAHDHRFEFTDVLGPVCYVAGAALGVVGLLQLFD